jgi:hypothetical protein
MAAPSLTLIADRSSHSTIILNALKLLRTDTDSNRMQYG